MQSFTEASKSCFVQTLGAHFNLQYERQARNGLNSFPISDCQLPICAIVRRTLVCRCCQTQAHRICGPLIEHRQTKVRRTIAQIGNWQSEIGNNLKHRLQLFHRSLQRSPGLQQICPEISHLGNAFLHVPQSETTRSNGTAFNFLPGTRCRDRRSILCANSVGRSKRRTVFVASRVHENSTGAIYLLEFQGHSVRMLVHEKSSDAMCKPCNLPKLRFAVEWNCNVKPFRARRLYP